MTGDNTPIKIREINLGLIDRIIRAAITLTMVYLFWTGHLKGYDGLSIRIVGVYLIVTAFTGVSPLYRLVGIRTCRKKAPETPGENKKS